MSGDGDAKLLAFDAQLPAWAHPDPTHAKLRWRIWASFPKAQDVGQPHLRDRAPFAGRAEALEGTSAIGRSEWSGSIRCGRGLGHVPLPKTHWTDDMIWSLAACARLGPGALCGGQEQA